MYCENTNTGKTVKKTTGVLGSKTLHSALHQQAIKHHTKFVEAAEGFY